MIFDQEYDIVLPLGAGCPAAMTLDYHHMRFASYPFDWLQSGSFDAHVEILANRFQDFLNPEDITIHPTITNTHCTVVKNTRWGYISHHDFPKDCSPQESHAEVQAKFTRRIERLISRLDAGARVLLLWLEYPYEQTSRSHAELKSALCRIQQTYPDASFSLFYVHNEEALSFDDYQVEQVNPEVSIVKAGYNAHMAAFPWEIAHDALSPVLSRIRLTSRFADKASYRKYQSYLRNIGNASDKWLRRRRFANRFAGLIMKKRIVWRLAKLIHELMK